MQLKSGLTLPNGQKHQKMCVCKSNHSIYEKTMIFQVLSICISRMRRANTCIHKLYVENWSEAAINTCNTKMYNFVILIFGGGGVNRYQVLIRCREKKSSNFIEECSCNIDDKKNIFSLNGGFYLPYLHNSLIFGKCHLNWWHCFIILWFPNYISWNFKYSFLHWFHKHIICVIQYAALIT